MCYDVRFQEGERGFHVCDIGSYGIMFNEKDLFDDETIRIAREWFKDNGKEYRAYQWACETVKWHEDKYTMFEYLKRYMKPMDLVLASQCRYKDPLMAEVIDNVLNSYNPYKKPEPKKSNGHAQQHGYVYLLKADNGYHKIGKAKHLDSRVTSLQVDLPVHLELVCSVESDDYDTLEKEYHTKYADKRDHGEWFALTDDDVNEIKKLMGVE